MKREEIAEVLEFATLRLSISTGDEICRGRLPRAARAVRGGRPAVSLTKNRRIRVKLSTDEATPVPSVTFVVAGRRLARARSLRHVRRRLAGNADLSRILTDYGFEGFPQRKGFPLTGHVELRYSEPKSGSSTTVSLPQDFRTRDFRMPWEGPEYRPARRRESGRRGAGCAEPPAPARERAASGQIPRTPGRDRRRPPTKPADTGAGKPADAPGRPRRPASRAPPRRRARSASVAVPPAKAGAQPKA